MANAVAGFRLDLNKTKIKKNQSPVPNDKLTTVHNQKKSVHRANIEISSDEDDDYSDEVSWVFKTTVLKEESAHFF